MHFFIEITSTLSEDLLAFYSNPVLWTALSPLERCPWIDIESFGYTQPNLRKAAWTLLQTLITSHLSKFFVFVITTTSIASLVRLLNTFDANPLLGNFAISMGGDGSYSARRHVETPFVISQT